MSDKLQELLRDCGGEHRAPDNWQRQVWSRIASPAQEPARPVESKAQWLAVACAALVVIAVGLGVLIRRGTADVEARRQDEVRPVERRRYQLDDALVRTERRIRELKREMVELAAQRDLAAVPAAVAREKQTRDLTRLQKNLETLVSVKKKGPTKKRRVKRPRRAPTAEKLNPSACISADSNPFCDVYLDDDGGVVLACDPADPLCGL